VFEETAAQEVQHALGHLDLLYPAGTMTPARCLEMAIAGDVETARVFEETAAQEVQHALGHLDLLYPAGTMTPARCLEMAIAGETHEYTEMYPSFRHTAVEEGNQAAVAEIDEQIAESREHAHQFRVTLEKAAKRFAALAKVEEKHANHYRDTLALLK